MHAGHIPEFYEHDSSQETLYSKLLEALVCEWAKRIGFEDSHLQKQKASKEDVTIKTDDVVIVCDAKGFRLGRSQGAPNVKDVIKKADYNKWLSSYAEEKRLGGLIAFPSLHSWKRSSDVFQYCSDKRNPILFLYYEHMSFYLLSEFDEKTLITFLESYEDTHPTKTKKVSEYFDRTRGKLFGDDAEYWNHYRRFSKLILQEKVHSNIKEIEDHLINSEKEIRNSLKKMNQDELIEKLVTSITQNRNGQILKNLKNIKKFRLQ